MRRFAPCLMLVALIAIARAGDEKKLTFETPKDWKNVEVGSGGFSPIEQWELAKAEGDDEAPQVKLYWFKGSGGSVDDNVKRWCSSYKTADGEKFPVEKAKKETFESNGLKITTVEVAGTYSPPPMMGGGEKKGQKLVAAYVDGEGGPWFVKLMGPEKSVDKHKDAFVKWLKTAKVK